jgi:hypothetical protein
MGMNAGVEETRIRDKSIVHSNLEDADVVADPVLLVLSNTL